MEIDRKEIFRYLGLKKNSYVEENLLSEIEICLKQLFEVVDMKSIYNVFDIDINENIINFGAFSVESSKLSQNLKGCEKAVLFAATLGTGTEILISRLSRLNISRALIMDACAITVIEQYCDECQMEIAKKMSEQGLFLRPRFSPGYGDFDIKHQRDFIRLLELPKKIGLMLSEGFMLIPSKSVTAVIGLSPNNENCNIKGCELCINFNCLFRR